MTFEDLYRQYQPWAVGYFTRKGHDDPEAAAQDVFLKASRLWAGKTFDNGGERNWVVRICRTTLIDYYRMWRSRPLQIEDFLLLVEPGDVFDGIEQFEAAQSVRDAVQRLPVAQRAAIIQRYWKSGELGPVVKERAYRGRQALARDQRLRRELENV